ncbi:DUF86 domain-containing protein [Porifericola rhodea]|uniref:HepT-like ribonuclease domain-containing protein n=1 Tax=Porifericola rhodea TaxID=930972 RepID=UPI002665F176|nr:HepT-like ribonuclease domain-containing protein [Porifericola rhodea]WKN32086.1 DUF86 domain-containing protein [Porifericola rhodea]
MKEEDQVHLSNISTMINEIDAYIGSMEYDQFSREESIRQSVATNLQQIGEAADLLSDEFKENFTSVDYNVLNALKRAKFDEAWEVDHRQIWNVVKNDLPEFRNVIETRSEQLDQQGEE